jgi:hypothetical protein
MRNNDIRFNRKFKTDYLKSYGFQYVAQDCYDKAVCNRIMIRVTEGTYVSLVHKATSPFYQDKYVELKAIDTEKKLLDLIRLLFDTN